MPEKPMKSACDRRIVLGCPGIIRLRFSVAAKGSIIQILLPSIAHTTMVPTPITHMMVSICAVAAFIPSHIAINVAMVAMAMALIFVEFMLVDVRPEVSLERVDAAVFASPMIKSWSARHHHES